MAFYILITLFSGAFFAEFVGYFLHKLIHSNKVEFLSKNHMIHHLKIYGPKMLQRPVNHYIYSTVNRASIAKIGLEWLLPIGFVFGIVLVGFWLIQVPILYRFIFSGVAISWALLMFSFVHDHLHVKDYWMEKNWFFKKRFLKARKLHDLHHMDLTDDGRMTQNFGICFFFFDWLFGSLSTTKKPFNKNGFEAAQDRYSYIYDDSGKVL